MNHNMLNIQITHADGRIVNDRRPGHTISGLMEWLSPFPRYGHRSLASVARELVRIERSEAVTSAFPETSTEQFRHGSMLRP